MLKNLDNKSLIQIKAVSRVLARTLTNERFYWIRIIKAYMKNFKGLEESWKEVINKSPVDTLKHLTAAIEKYCKYYPFKQVTPLHIVAYEGSLELFQFVIMRSPDKNPDGTMCISLRRWVDSNSFEYYVKYEPHECKCECKTTPLHLAAMLGNSEKCRVIMDYVDEDNLKNL